MRADKEQVLRDIKMYLRRRMVARFEAGCKQGYGPGSAEGSGSLREKGHQPFGLVAEVKSGRD